MSVSKPEIPRWQDRFQKICYEFVDEIDCLTYYIRKNPDDKSSAHQNVIYEGLVSLWSQVEKIRDAGLDMVAESPRCPLILQERRYWFIAALADQTPFEGECAAMEFDLDKWARAVLHKEVEYLWVAGFLETISLQLLGQHHLIGYRIAQKS